MFGIYNAGPYYLNIDAVDGKEDGDGAVDCHRQGEHEEPAPIPERQTSMNATGTKSFLSQIQRQKQHVL